MTTLGPYDLNTIITGDARELAKAIPDESVDLIFTDPVYDRIEDYRWLAETAARVLKPGGNCAAYQAHVFYPETFQALGKHLTYRWILTEQKIGTQSSIFGRRVLCRTKHILLYCRPPIGKKWVVDYTDKYPGSNINHKWGKGNSALYWLKQFETSVILDPFAGGGSLISACKMLQRNYLAFEIDPDTADMARKRVAETQPPLPIVYHEQMELLT